MSDSPVSMTTHDPSSGSVTPTNVVPSILTPEQEKAVTLIYNDAKEIIQTITSAPNTNIVITVSKIIGEMITLVEAISANQAALEGADKKVVVLDVIQKILNDVVSDEALRQKLVTVCNEIADSTIDIMIDVSNGLKKMEETIEETVEEDIKKVRSSCCGIYDKN